MTIIGERLTEIKIGQKVIWSAWLANSSPVTVSILPTPTNNIFEAVSKSGLVSTWYWTTSDYTNYWILVEDINSEELPEELID